MNPVSIVKPRKGRKKEAHINDSAIYTIKDLADMVGVSIKTIKTWEQKEFIPKAKRNVFGWRKYTTEEIEALKKTIENNNYFRGQAQGPP